METEQPILDLTEKQESEQPILDLTEKQESEDIIPGASLNLEMDFSDFDLGLGF